ncbi:MAG: hypothetical protein IPM98_21795 [Lewinellaceae bacterium]|nr:hypothetical protein [Lewinellaceae bacterium]
MSLLPFNKMSTAWAAACPRASTVFMFLAGLAALASCSDDKRRISDYYFPVQSLTSGLVYEYASEEGDTTDRRYWYYRSFVRDSGIFLAGTQYDRYLEINQIVREKIVETGSVARNAFLYETDTTTGKSIPIPAAIESPDLFPFQVQDSLGVFLFKLQYHPLSDSTATIYLIRNRRYLGDGPDFELAGKKYPTVRFGLQEAIGHSKDGSAEIEGSGEEWYAKGIGLVYYRKAFGKEDRQIRFAFRLRERFPMTELERRGEASHGH